MEWIRRARRQDGLITRDDLIAGGLTDARIRRMVTRTELRRVFPGVYLHGSVPPSWRQRVRAATLWSGGVASHDTAATLLGMQVPFAVDARVHITVAHAWHRQIPAGIRMHRLPLRPSDVRRRDGIPVTSPSRTALELLRIGRAPKSTFFDRQLQLGVLTPDLVSEDLRRFPGRDGNATLRRLVAGHLPGAEAESERRLHRLLRRNGFIGWEPQYWIEVGTRRFRVDAAFPQIRLIIEIDGKRYHEDPERFESDKIGDIDVQRIRWRIIRITCRRLENDEAGVVSDIRDLMAVRRSELA